MKAVQTELIKPPCSLPDRTSVRPSVRASPSRFQRRAALLFITLDSLFTSGLKRLFLQRFAASLGLLGSLL